MVKVVASCFMLLAHAKIPNSNPALGRLHRDLSQSKHLGMKATLFVQRHLWRRLSKYLILEFASF